MHVLTVPGGDLKNFNILRYSASSGHFVISFGYMSIYGLGKHFKIELYSAGIGHFVFYFNDMTYKGDVYILLED